MIPWNTVGKEEPKKVSLDAQLDYILKSNAAVQRHFDRNSEEDYEKLIPAIKQAFIDEGWVHSSTPQAQMMQDMVNLHANMKQDAIRLGLALTPEVDHD